MSQPDPTMISLARAAHDVEHGFSGSFIDLVIVEAEDVKATHDSLTAQASILPDPRKASPAPTKNQATSALILSLELWIAQ